MSHTECPQRHTHRDKTAMIEIQIRWCKQHMGMRLKIFNIFCAEYTEQELFLFLLEQHEHAMMTVQLSKLDSSVSIFNTTSKQNNP